MGGGSAARVAGAGAASIPASTRRPRQRTTWNREPLEDDSGEEDLRSGAGAGAASIPASIRRPKQRSTWNREQLENDGGEEDLRLGGRGSILAGQHKEAEAEDNLGE